MSLVTGVGVSVDLDLAAALDQAAKAARDQCPEPAVVLAFITHNHSPDKLPAAAAALADAFPNAQTAGGQVNGITFEEARYDAVFANRHAVAVVAFGGDGVKGSIAMRGSVTDQPRESGRIVAREALERLGAEPEGGIFLGIGLSHFPPVDQQLLDGIRDVAPRLRLTGSGLCGGLQMDGSYDPGRAFFGRELIDKGILLIVLGGALRLGFSAANGMQPVGPGAFITKCEGPEIIELNGKPAKDVVLDLLAGDTPDLRKMFEANPQVMGVERGITLAVPDPEGDFYWCHFPGMFTPRGGVMEPFGPRKGMGLAVTRIDPQSCMTAVSEAAGMLEQDAAAQSFEITVAFSCALRGFTLGAEAAHEDAELRKHIKARRHIGIIANGEIGCYRHGRPMFTGWVFALMGGVAE